MKKIINVFFYSNCFWQSCNFMHFWRMESGKACRLLHLSSIQWNKAHRLLLWLFDVIYAEFSCFSYHWPETWTWLWQKSSVQLRLLLLVRIGLYSQLFLLVAVGLYLFTTVSIGRCRSVFFIKLQVYWVVCSYTYKFVYVL